MPNIKQLQILDELKKHDFTNNMVDTVADVFEGWLSNPETDKLNAAERGEAFYLIRKYVALIREFDHPPSHAEKH